MDKILLMKDLCPRLPYGIKCDHFGKIKEVLNVERKTKIKMNIEINKPRWKNKEWTFNILPYLSVTKISNLVIEINVGWLFWGITICNDF